VSYEVRLEVFEGPIDLLLHLITRQRVDIYDVSIATITEEYLAAVEALGSMDLEVATGFLVVAATLLELKSARLLPTRADDPNAARLLEERDLLLARLVECSTFRDAGGWISGQLRAGAARHGRTVMLEERFVNVAPDLLANTTLDHLLRAAVTVFTPAPVIELDTSHIAPIRASVKDAITTVADLLELQGSASFEELCGGSTEKLEVVVRFLALLELYKAGAIELHQAERFGDIRATWTGETDAAEVLEEAEEYVLSEDPGGKTP
jgi:segregation and condensation protein A